MRGADQRSSNDHDDHVRDVDNPLERGRRRYGERAWAQAYAALALADQATPLGAEDLELLAMSAYLIGRDDDYLSALERAHNAYLAGGEGLRAVRGAFWLGLRLLFRGETGRATGWLARAQRLLERETRDCVEHGYLLLPVVNEQVAARNYDAALAAAARAVEIGDRFNDRDLAASARHLQGRVLIEQGRTAEGLALLDDAMLAVSAGELSPLVAGLVYCSVIEGCQQVYAWGRAREWTSALSEWCAAQPEMAAFTGICLVHRAEIMQLGGAWETAIAEARRACERCIRVANQRAAAAAFYQQGEVHRLRGEFAAAEEAYRSASQWGWEPHPGLALLRAAQGRADAAAAAIRRAVTATRDPLERTKLLPACVEILLGVGELEEARSACRELEQIAERFGTDVLSAMAAHCRGAVELVDGDAKAALVALRRASQIWQQIGAPYLAGRVRMLVGLACRTLGDMEGGALELDAARAVFEQLGAAPDRARIDALTRGARPDRPHGLTQRELQVLRLVAAGKTNKTIAAELSLSEKTIDRHVSNIFTKLDVPSRAGATAFAYEHKLV
jgi:ATP/maltotriose-dependent transcriptional regulator MalT